MSTHDVALKRIPESLLVELLTFWDDTKLCELTISRYDREWKVKYSGFVKGKS